MQDGQHPLLHSPPASDYAESNDDHSLHRVAHHCSGSISSSSSQQPVLPPPPTPLDYETQPRGTRPPLPIPPPRLQRPSLAPTPTAKGKGRPVILSEEKQAYARALGLDTLAEESPTSPTSPPVYVQDREADAREGLSKTGFRGREDGPIDEKGRVELARVAEAQEQQAERELEEDSLSEKARMAREEEQQRKEEISRQEAVEAAELAKNVSQLDLGGTPREALPPFPSASLATDVYPLDSKGNSPTEGGSPIDEVPSYDAPAIPPNPIASPSDPRAARGPQEVAPLPSVLPPPPLHQQYSIDHRHFPPPSQRSSVLYGAPAAPAPNSYIPDRSETDEFGAGRPPLARHMSLQSDVSRSMYFGISATWDGSRTGLGRSSEARREMPRSAVTSSSGFYGSGIGLAMNSEAQPTFGSGSDRSSSSRAGSEMGERQIQTFGDQPDEGHSSHFHRTPSVAGLPPPSAFAQSNSVGYRPQVVPPPSHQQSRTFQHSYSQPPYSSPLSSSSLPIISAAAQPAGYYTVSPGVPPIPFYTPAQPHSVPPHGYFTSAPAQPSPHLPSPHLPHHAGSPAPLLHHQHLPPIASPPLNRPASMAPGSVRGRSSLGTVRSFFGRKGRKENDLSDAVSEEGDRMSLWSRK